MTFETEHSLLRKKKAMETFVAIFGGSFTKLNSSDIGYRVYDKDKNLIAYAEVINTIKPIYNAYPLIVEAKKIVKLVDKRLNPVVIWSCEDGIIYGKVSDLKGEIKWGRITPQDISFGNTELITYYDKQKAFKYVRYV